MYRISLKEIQKPQIVDWNPQYLGAANSYLLINNVRWKSILCLTSYLNKHLPNLFQSRNKNINFLWIYNNLIAHYSFSHILKLSNNRVGAVVTGTKCNSHFIEQHS